LNHIFCPDDAKSDDAAGLHLIEAPGVVGEVKLVMRKIKTLLLNGVAAGDILVSMRDMSLYADLLREFASEYEVPIDLESTTPLARVPAVAALLKAASLPETDWPFAGTAALLRSSYLHPSWPEVAADPEIALDTELLLRWRGEPRGRVAYLQSVTAQARDLEPALEDEAAASSHRRYLQQLAERCLPFLTRFLSAWDARPTEATLHDYIRWLQSLADDLGFTNSATGRDADGLTRFFAELGTWADRDQMLHPRPPKLTTAEFLRLAEWIADANGLPRTPSEPDRVRIVPAELAAGLTYQHLFLMGLSEGRFPQLNTGPRIYDEQERRDFHGVGIAWSVGENRLSSEMLMFLRLVAGANHSVTLSYPAVDERGQALLSATFLKNVRDLFVADALPTLRREMLIEGLDTDPPLSPTEHRWRYSRTSEGSGQLSADLVDHLRTAKVMAQSRFESKDHGRFDGLLTAAACRSKIAAQFDPSAAYSATALENYVACPFKFFVGSVLKLQALPEPGAEIDARMRGAAFHRAVARFHRAHTTPRADIIVQLANEVFNAVTEYRQRSFSPITQALWDLEHQRLRRHTTRYGDHWTKFRDKYDGPIPIHTEVDFGPGQANSALVVTSDNLEIRIRGRIDRIDVVDLEDGGQGFWIIDYKTGRSSNYSGPAIDRFTALQMSLYAYAASEQVADCRARRPLGLAYWFPTRGAKVVKRWPSENDWLAMRDRIKAVLIEIVGRIRAGEFPLHPNNPDNCTATCDFGQMCRIAQSRGIEKNWMLSLPVVEGADESD
jgi:ATP-dependent helicase/DNAse subunit B